MSDANGAIPTYDLYGERRLFPDLMHCERIRDRAARHGWTIRAHRHARLHQFFLILDADAGASVGGGAVRITGPTLLSVPRWTTHAFDFPTGARGHVLSVLPETLPELFDAAASGVDLRAWASVETVPDIASLFESVIEELADAAPLRDAMLKARVVEIAARLVRSTRTDAGAPPGVAASRHIARLERLIRQRFRERWRVQDYARELGLSPEHLGRVARTVTGRTPVQLVEARTLHEARTLLAYTRRPVSQIAHELGYADPAYFARAFRRVESASPSAYRASRGGSVGSARAAGTFRARAPSEPFEAFR